MAQKTLSQILYDANSVLDLEYDLPVGDELSTRANYADQAIWDASALGQFQEFKQEYLVGLSNSATVPMPSNFREVMQNPQMWDGSGWNEYNIIEAEEKYSQSPNERYCYVLGNADDGYNMIFNQPIDGSTLSVLYQRLPNGLVTLTDRCELSDPQYVVRKIESYVLYSRTDDRFTIAEQRAQTALSNMLGRSSKGSTPNRDTKSKFSNPLRNLS